MMIFKTLIINNIFLLTLILPLTVFSQANIFFGISSFDTEYSNIGFNVGATLNHFYFDLAANAASGKGEPLAFQSSSSYQVEKTSILVFNIGYAIFLDNKEMFRLIPFVGWARTADIFQDPIAFDTYFLANAKSQVNLGITVQFISDSKFGFQLGIGTFEKVKGSLVFGL